MADTARRAASGSPAADPLQMDDVMAMVAGPALERAGRQGCRHAEVRVERVRTQMVVVRDGVVETALDDVETGAGLRVVHRGAFGFAATDQLGPDAGPWLADAAVSLADACAPGVRQAVDLADEPVHGPVTWVAEHRTDPTSVALVDKVARLTEWCERSMGSPEVSHVTASVMAVSEEKHYLDLAGTVTRQFRVRVHPVVEALSVRDDGTFESMRTLAPPTARGWEYCDGGGAVDTEVGGLAELLAEKVRAPSVEPGPTDLVIDPSNLWLTIHESVGHALELDRALGYEAAYAGTSFATVDQLGALRYGSPMMHVTGDRTVPYGLATVGFDDEGVAAQQFDLVRDGVLVGYQLDRRMAAEHGLGRSNGCAFADSHAHVPLQRMANVSLAADPRGPTTEELVAGTDHGVLVVGDKSWSIDMQRHNFQFTGQRFYRIERGRIVGQLRDVAYQSRTTDFWRSLDAVGSPATWVLGGAMNCGKGQPGQVAPVSHGCPVARFRQVNVLNARAESGR